MNSLQVSGNSSTFHVTIEKSPEQRRGADLMSDGSSFFMHKIQWGCSIRLCHCYMADVCK